MKNLIMVGLLAATAFHFLGPAGVILVGVVLLLASKK